MHLQRAIFGIYMEIIWNTSVFSLILERWSSYLYMQIVYADVHYFITDATVELLTINWDVTSVSIDYTWPETAPTGMPHLCLLTIRGHG
jgi:hypothetical protein